MEKKYDVTTLGELLIDFTENGESAQGNPMLEANPGGAVSNCVAMMTKLGKKAAFIGKVGNDQFGRQLLEVTAKAGIDVSGVVTDPTVHTTLAFVHTFPDGDRDFSFNRDPGADMMLSVSDVKDDLIRDCRLFHFGTLSMTSEVCREATWHALDVAREAGALISFDPNLREPLWPSLDAAREMTAYGLSRADILKISDNEITWFTGREDYDEGVSALKAAYPNLKLILVSCGKEGSRGYSGENKAVVPPFLLDNTIETTGAGDTFFGCVLSYVLDHGLKDYSVEELTDMLAFANAGAAIITTRKGALKVMPKRSEIEDLLSSKGE